jgi:hypothetical protein
MVEVNKTPVAFDQDTLARCPLSLFSKVMLTPRVIVKWLFAARQAICSIKMSSPHEASSGSFAWQPRVCYVLPPSILAQVSPLILTGWRQDSLLHEACHPGHLIALALSVSLRMSTFLVCQEAYQRLVNWLNKPVKPIKVEIETTYILIPSADRLFRNGWRIIGAFQPHFFKLLLSSC